MRKPYYFLCLSVPTFHYYPHFSMSIPTYCVCPHPLCLSPHIMSVPTYNVCPHFYVCPHLLCLSPPFMSVPTYYVCPHLLCPSPPIMSVPTHHFFADNPSRSFWECQSVSWMFLKGIWTGSGRFNCFFNLRKGNFQRMFQNGNRKTTFWLRNKMEDPKICWNESRTIMSSCKNTKYLFSLFYVHAHFT